MKDLYVSKDRDPESIKAFFMEEIWKDVPGYEGMYYVSNLGKVKNKRNVMLTGRINSRGYLRAALNKNGKTKEFRFHQLVAMAFLNHKPCGMERVVDHINRNKLDNRVENLRVISQRENCVKTGKTSKYMGVHFCNTNKKYIAKTSIKGENKYIGKFDNEYEAHLAYQSALKNIV